MRRLLGASLAALALAGQPALAGSGIYGGWAADPADCKYVNVQNGLTADVQAGIITPSVTFHYGGYCRITDAQKDNEGAVGLRLDCEDDDGERYKESVAFKLSGADTMRGMVPDFGVTTYHRCWNLPADWEQRVQDALQ